MAGRATVLAQPENELHPHHLNPYATESIQSPIGRIESHPSDPAILGLQNLSSHIWKAQLNNAQTVNIAPGQRCNLAQLEQIETHLGVVALAR
jgi:hypothetical protein